MRQKMKSFEISGSEFKRKLRKSISRIKIMQTIVMARTMVTLDLSDPSTKSTQPTIKSPLTHISIQSRTQKSREISALNTLKTCLNSRTMKLSRWHSQAGHIVPKSMNTFTSLKSPPQDAKCRKKTLREKLRSKSLKK